MNKITFRLLSIVFITMMLISLNMGLVYADSIAGINCTTSINQGENFTVSLILPQNAYSAQANIKVTYSDGTSATEKLVYMSGMSDFPNSVTFNAKVAGSASVSASNIIIVDSTGTTLENGGSKSASLTIVGKQTPSSNPGTTPSTPTTPTTPTTPSNPSNPSDNSGSSNNNSNSGASNQVTFSDINETVYTTEKCNVRESYSTSSKKLGTVDKGTKLTRTGTASNGWSRVSYNGQIAYIYSQYLTKDAPSNETETQNEQEVKIKDVKDTMYATQNCNLRKSWSTDSDKVGYLLIGDEVTRTGTTDNGWSRIKYQGNEVFVATRLLSSQKPEVNEDEQEKVEPDEIEDNLEQTEDEILLEEVGVLPEVGNNVSTIIYYVSTIITLIISIIGILYLRKRS